LWKFDCYKRTWELLGGTKSDAVSIYSGSNGMYMCRVTIDD